MRRGKRFFENDNLFIYVGAIVFILLAVALGIIMYMASRTGVRIENGQTSQEQQVQENTEAVTSEIGKTVEEQQNQTQTNIQNEEKAKNKEKKKQDQKTQRKTQK